MAKSIDSQSGIFWERGHKATVQERGTESVRTNMKKGKWKKRRHTETESEKHGKHSCHMRGDWINVFRFWHNTSPDFSHVLVGFYQWPEFGGLSTTEETWAVTADQTCSCQMASFIQGIGIALWKFRTAPLVAWTPLCGTVLLCGIWELEIIPYQTGKLWYVITSGLWKMLSFVQQHRMLEIH